METGMPAGPRWVGIGAQRSGTTWFTDLVIRHPEVCLARNGRKEQHFFDDAHMQGWSEERGRIYARRFDRAGGRAPGEFSPNYLRQPWVAPLLLDSVSPPPLLVVLLRDPIERFRSATRLYHARHFAGGVRGNASRQMGRLHASLAQWAGMYATQLDLWAQSFPRRSFHLIQYERMAADPFTVVGEFWSRLGLGPIRLGDTSAPSRTSSDPDAGIDLGEMPAMLDLLHRLYAPEVTRLEEDWGIDRSLWPHFSD